MSKSNEVLTRFYGGPHDGEEKVLPTPLSELLERKAEPVREKADGVVVALVTVVHLYVLQSEGNQHVYTYQGDRIEREEVE